VGQNKTDKNSNNNSNSNGNSNSNSNKENPNFWIEMLDSGRGLCMNYQTFQFIQNSVLLFKHPRSGMLDTLQSCLHHDCYRWSDVALTKSNSCVARKGLDRCMYVDFEVGQKDPVIVANNHSNLNPDEIGISKKLLNLFNNKSTEADCRLHAEKINDARKRFEISLPYSRVDRRLFFRPSPHCAVRLLRCWHSHYLTTWPRVLRMFLYSEDQWQMEFVRRWILDKFYLTKDDGDDDDGRSAGSTPTERSVIVVDQRSDDANKVPVKYFSYYALRMLCFVLRRVTNNGECKYARDNTAETSSSSSSSRHQQKKKPSSTPTTLSSSIKPKDIPSIVDNGVDFSSFLPNRNRHEDTNGIVFHLESPSINSDGSFVCSTIDLTTSDDSVADKEIDVPFDINFNNDGRPPTNISHSDCTNCIDSLLQMLLNPYQTVNLTEKITNIYTSLQVFLSPWVNEVYISRKPLFDLLDAIKQSQCCGQIVNGQQQQQQQQQQQHQHQHQQRQPPKRKTTAVFSRALEDFVELLELVVNKKGSGDYVVLPNSCHPYIQEKVFNPKFDIDRTYGRIYGLVFDICRLTYRQGQCRLAPLPHILFYILCQDFLVRDSEIVKNVLCGITTESIINKCSLVCGNDNQSSSISGGLSDNYVVRDSFINQHPVCALKDCIGVYDTYAQYLAEAEPVFFQDFNNPNSFAVGNSGVLDLAKVIGSITEEDLKNKGSADKEDAIICRNVNFLDVGSVSHNKLYKFNKKINKSMTSRPNLATFMEQEWYKCKLGRGLELNNCAYNVIESFIAGLEVMSIYHPTSKDIEVGSGGGGGLDSRPIRNPSSCLQKLFVPEQREESKSSSITNKSSSSQQNPQTAESVLPSNLVSPEGSSLGSNSTSSSPTVWAAKITRQSSDTETRSNNSSGNDSSSSYVDNLSLVSDEWAQEINNNNNNDRGGGGEVSFFTKSFTDPSQDNALCKKKPRQLNSTSSTNNGNIGLVFSLEKIGQSTPKSLSETAKTNNRVKQRYVRRMTRKFYSADIMISEKERKEQRKLKLQKESIREERPVAETKRRMNSYKFAEIMERINREHVERHKQEMMNWGLPPPEIPIYRGYLTPRHIRGLYRFPISRKVIDRNENHERSRRGGHEREMEAEPLPLFYLDSGGLPWDSNGSLMDRPVHFDEAFPLCKARLRSTYTDDLFFRHLVDPTNIAPFIGCHPHILSCLVAYPLDFVQLSVIDDDDEDDDNNSGSCSNTIEGSRNSSIKCKNCMIDLGINSFYGPPPPPHPSHTKRDNNVDSETTTAVKTRELRSQNCDRMFVDVDEDNYMDTFVERLDINMFGSNLSNPMFTRTIMQMANDIKQNHQ
jgi:hypothetical protein